jgi:hypothetical protein
MEFREKDKRNPQESLAERLQEPVASPRSELPRQAVRLSGDFSATVSAEFHSMGLALS